jgi:GTPase SAR1 family protein
VPQSTAELQKRSRPLNKTCKVSYRFCDKCWVPSRIPTVGVDFGSKRVLVGSGTAQQSVHLDFFDLAGAQEYVAVREEMYADAQGAHPLPSPHPPMDGAMLPAEPFYW